MKDYSSHFINGEWRISRGAKTTLVDDAATGLARGHVVQGTIEEVNAAVEAAKTALHSWSTTLPLQRAGFVRAIAEGLTARREELAHDISREVGMPLKLARRIQVEAPIAAWQSTASIGESLPFEETLGNSLITQEPVGVVAAITPWNYPLHQITGKLAPALMAGCTVVLKPSELAPAAAQALGEVVRESGLPPGVINIVFGGRATGEALASNPGIDMVSFTGSTTVGRSIASNAGSRLKRVSLELGGKSPSIALSDADPGQVVRHATAMCFLNSGQTCSAITRLLIPEAQYSIYRERLQDAVASLVVGDPQEMSTRIGPLVSAQQRERVLSFIEEAERAGFDLIAGGTLAPVPADGYFVAPTVFGRVPHSARLACEEVFGPVLAVITYTDVEQAISFANDTGYGLAAAVWSSSCETSLRVARRLRAGQVDVNGAAFNPLAPFGGFGLSGIGREGGRYGIEEFLEPRAIQLPV